ncbi:MAG: hypothetical protein ABH803_03345 [Candidatus Micrarchaeota archaeon]
MKNGESIEALFFALVVCVSVFSSLFLFQGLLSAVVALFFVLLLFFFLGKNGFFSGESERLKLVEKEIPLFIELFSASTSSFEERLREGTTGFGELSVEVKKVLLAVEKGVSVSDALSAFARKNNSVFCRKLASALESFFFKNDCIELNALGEAYSLKKLNDLRSFSSKAALIGLVFVSVSLVVPALFSAFLTIGASFLELTFSDLQVLALFIVVFPVVDYVLLFFMLKQVPVF